MKMLRPFKEWTTYKGHSGIDYPYRDDTLVPASGDGTVIYSGYMSERGGYGVRVQYAPNRIDGYFHSDRHDWRLGAGSIVRLGTPLMEIGGTGLNSTGPHLHHEVYVNGALQKDANYWKYVDQSPNGYVGAAQPAVVKPPQLLERKLEMHEALLVYKPTNELLLVNLKDKTIINLGNNTKSGLRAYYANNHKWAHIEEPEWTERFKDYKYI